MEKLTLGQAQAACKGIFFGDDAHLAEPLSAVVSDSRKVKQGCLFVALSGERFDGHTFVQMAQEKGAAACLVQRHLEGNIPYILVPDTLTAFQQIAGFYRDQFNIEVVGITGSVGKTTTKEMVASVLSKKYRVHKSYGNFNNQIGVPMTLFEITTEHQVAVVEMGTNHFGEIAAVAKIAKPDICLFTNIGDSHLEHLGNREGVLKAKAEMLEFKGPNARVLINGDDEQLTRLQTASGDNLFTFGLGEHNKLRALNCRPQGLFGTDCAIELEGEPLMEVHIPSPGQHMVYNALAGIAVGLFMDMTAEQIAAGVADFKPADNRMNIETTQHYTVLNDVYNANPASMRAAIDVLSYASGRKVCILGDMFELGENTRELHFSVGRYAAQKGMDLVLAVGDLAQEIARGVQAERKTAIHYRTQQQLIDSGLLELRPGDNVLIKASRGMGLEKTLNALLEI